MRLTNKITADQIGPTIRTPRWLADDDQSTHFEDRHGGADDRGRRSEPTGDDSGDRLVEETGEFPCLGGEHADALTEAESSDEPVQMVSACRAAIDEDKPQIGSSPGDHQARNPTSTAQIDHYAGDVTEGLDERLAVIDHVGHRRGAEHAETLGGGEGPDQRRIRRGRGAVGSAHPGLTMILR